MGFNSVFKGLTERASLHKLSINLIFPVKYCVNNLTFMGPCVVIIFYNKYISNKMQRYTVYFIWKQLYMFRVVLPPIIRSANNYICSICYLSHCYCYLPLWWKSWNCSAVPTLMGGGTTRNMQSSFQINKLYNVASCWIYIIEYCLNRFVYWHFRLPYSSLVSFSSTSLCI